MAPSDCFLLPLKARKLSAKAASWKVCCRRADDFGGGGGGFGGGGGRGGPAPRPGDWPCPQCGNNCFASK